MSNIAPRTESPVKMPKSKRRMTKHQLETYHWVTGLDPRSPICEAYRIVRTNLNFKNLDGNLKFIVVTSAIAKEGKSITAAQMAISLAQEGKKVVLVDADLRKPTQHKIFGIDVTEGLSDALMKDIDPLSVCKQIGEKGPLVLTTGILPPNPSDVLGSSRMKQVLTAMGNQVAFVIVDSPPVLGLNDTLALAPVADGFLIVIGSRRVPRQALRHTLQQLKNVGANVVGAVVNGVEPSSRTGSYYYY